MAEGEGERERERAREGGEQGQKAGQLAWPDCAQNKRGHVGARRFE